MSEPVRPSSPEKAIDVALTEYKALRDEIVGCFTKQGAVLTLGLAALGAIFTAAAKDSGNDRLLLSECRTIADTNSGSIENPVPLIPEDPRDEPVSVHDVLRHQVFAMS